MMLLGELQMKKMKTMVHNINACRFSSAACCVCAAVATGPEKVKKGGGKFEKCNDLTIVSQNISQHPQTLFI
jgi:hypothetical protein